MRVRATTLGILATFVASNALAAGVLRPVGASATPVEVVTHHADIVINNGFARTTVTQTFANPGSKDIEAIYRLAVPQSASLSEVTILVDEKEINGEVLPKRRAEEVYRQERNKGNDAGLAEKNGFRSYQFAVARVPAAGQVTLRFVYYQPLKVDTGVGRYVYPLEDGHTEDQANSFWTANDAVSGPFSVAVELKSGVPVAAVRTPGFDGSVIDRIDSGLYRVRVDRTNARLDTDFVFYYRLQEDLPGRVDLIAHKPDATRPGTFMLVVTPGADLQPLDHGADFVFVLDLSGSMRGGKLATLADGVGKAIGELSAEDRYRVVLFADDARELHKGWLPATPGNVATTLKAISNLTAGGSTNFYLGLRKALSGLDDDRATTLVLVTDAVANTGVVDPAAFRKLVKKYDLRVFGFLIGNSSNWPLMRTICDSTGGFYAQMSNADDVLGQIKLAKSKITHEALHDVKLEVKGVRTHFEPNAVPTKIYRGQQLVLFGRYDDGGAAELRLQASLTGQDKTYRTRFEFPTQDARHPELERLWALDRIDIAQTSMNAGLLPADDAENLITQLGVRYSIVTDYTSMVVLNDETFRAHGIDRKNARRVATERTAEAAQASQPIATNRVDQTQPMFDRPAPTVTEPKRAKRSRSRPSGGGGGAIDPISGTLALSLAGLGWAASRKKRK